MDMANRRFFETRIGANLANIRIHTGETAARSAVAIGAEAYTVGNRIVFGRGKYQPGTEGGQRLLAHELAHAVNAEVSGNSSCTERMVIHRSIQSGGIRYRDEVVDKVRQTLEEANSFYEALRTGPPAGINVTGGRLSGRPNIAWRFLFPAGPHTRTLVQLWSLGEAFNPGEGVDLPSNNFVYTCNCGWLDMGHFFFTSLAGYLESLGIHATQSNINLSTLLNLIWQLHFPSVYSGGGLRAYETSLEAEEGQQRYRERLEAGEELDPGQIGTAQSAFTLEDLRSNWEGAHFGEQAALSNQRDRFNVLEELEAVFGRCRPANLPLPPIEQRVNTQNFDTSVQRLIRETLGENRISIGGASHLLPRQQFVQDRTSRPVPVELVAAREFC
ncbi:eCIS core domain-containing protein [Halomicronema hongdechloris]|nr:DUF4157 domain-containing protein [Halomicronema hongdechloris]